MVVPVFAPIQSSGGNGELVGYLDGVVNWNDLFASNLSEDVADITVQLSDDCGEYHQFLVQGPKSSYVGTGEITKNDFDTPELFKVNNKGTFDLGVDLTHTGSANVCIPTMTMYATEDFRDSYKNGDSALYTAMVLIVFFVTTLIFSCYFCMVRKRHARLESTVEKTAEIVTNVFPGDAGKRILAEAKEFQPNRGFGAKAELKHMLGMGHASLNKQGIVARNEGKPIADFFPSCTIGTSACSWRTNKIALIPPL